MGQRMFVQSMMEREPNVGGRKVGQNHQAVTMVGKALWPARFLIRPEPSGVFFRRVRYDEILLGLLSLN